MVNLDIHQKIEEEKAQAKKREEKRIKEEALMKEEDKKAFREEESKGHSEGKYIVIMIVIIVGLFMVTVGSFYTYNKITSANVVNIDELHQKNLEKELKEEEGYIYNGFSFVKADGLWWTEMNKFGTRLKVPLRFSPKELENIPITGTFSPAFNDYNDIYLAFDMEVNDKYYNLAASELIWNIREGLDRMPVGSCTTNHPACDNRTIVSCSNNTTGRAVIELAYSNETRIDIIETCIKLSGREFNLTKTVDRVLYQWYGVMK